MSDVVRKMVVEEGMRIDGRGLDDVRPITSRASVLPRTHGSALFTRGEVGTGTLAPSTFISTTAAFPDNTLALPSPPSFSCVRPRPWPS